MRVLISPKTWNIWWICHIRQCSKNFMKYGSSIKRWEYAGLVWWVGLFDSNFVVAAGSALSIANLLCRCLYVPHSLFLGLSYALLLIGEHSRLPTKIKWKFKVARHDAIREPFKVLHRAFHVIRWHCLFSTGHITGIWKSTLTVFFSISCSHRQHSTDRTNGSVSTPLWLKTLGLLLVYLEAQPWS